MENDKADKTAKTGDRSERLAAELRENLRRRKGQERGRKGPETGGNAKQPGPPRGSRQDP
jgi:hypothetical protein